MRVCRSGAPSLTRGRVCCLQLLLTLASVVTFGSESRRTSGHTSRILLSQIRDFPFSRLLRLAGWQWRYSTPPQHRRPTLLSLRPSLCLMLRPTVSRPVYLGIKHPSGAYDRILLIVWQLWVSWFGAPSLTRGRVCRLQLLLASPAQSFSGQSPVGLVASFCCQIRDFPFRRLLRLAGSRWRYLTPPPNGSLLSLSLMLRPTVSRPVCLGVKHSSQAYDQIFITCVTVTVLFLWGALSDERSGLSFVCAAGPCQRSLPRVGDP
jgi:hypothetical protein